MEPILPPAAIFFIGALLIPLFKGNIKKIFLLFIPLISILHMFSIEEYIGWTYVFLDFELIFIHADRLSLFMGYIFTIMALLVTIYNLNLKKDSDHMISFIYMGCALGIIFAGDLFTFIVFWKIMPVASTILILLKRDEPSLNAGYRYFLMHIIGSSFLLAGIVVHYIHTGSIGMDIAIYGIIPILVIIGIGFKAAFIPIHTWIPDAYPSAHFGTSVILSIFSTKVAVYALARLVSNVEAVAYMGALMAVYGVVFALFQSNARKLLSYHIISQVGYMVAGVGIGTQIGIDGGLFHVWNHILYKSLLFMCIGVAIYRTDKHDLTELGGLARKMPITTIACIIAALSIAGVPLFNGFLSKSMVYEAANYHDVLYWMLKLTSVGTFLSFYKFTYFGFLMKREVEVMEIPNFELMRKKETNVMEAPLTMIIPIIIIAFLCVLGGIYPNLVTNYLPNYSEFKFSFDEMIGSFSILIMTGAVFIFNGKIFKRNIFIPHEKHVKDFDYLYINITHAFIRFSKNPVVFFSAFIDLLYVKMAYSFTWICKNPVVLFSVFIDWLYAKMVFYFLWFCKVPMSFFNIKVKPESFKKENILLNIISKITKTFGIRDIYDTNNSLMNIERFSLRADKKIKKIDHEKMMLSDMSISFSMLFVIIMLGILLIYAMVMQAI